jgi:hypothetical protein
MVEGVADDPLNMDYQQWEVAIHIVHDWNLIGHVR